MKFRTLYEYDQTVADSVTVYNTLDSKAMQEFKDECDINNIIARYKVFPYVDPFGVKSGGMPLFEDFSAVPDLMEAQNQIIEAQELFMELPSELRRRFDNDPLLLLEFLQDEGNRAEAITLGLLPKPVDNITNPVIPTAETDTSSTAQLPT